LLFCCVLLGFCAEHRSYLGDASKSLGLPMQRGLDAGGGRGTSLSSQEKGGASRMKVAIPLQADAVLENVPFCSSMGELQCGIGCSCFTDCGKSCAMHGSIVAPGMKLVSDEKQTVSRGCGKSGGKRLLCTSMNALGIVGGIPLCGDLGTNSCGPNCKCWSDCTEHSCKESTLERGFLFDKKSSVLTSAGCRVDLTRWLCSSYLKHPQVNRAQPVNGWVTALFIAAFPVAALLFQ